MRNRTVPDGIEQAIRTVMWLVIIVTCLTLTVLMYDTIVVTRETRPWPRSSVLSGSGVLFA